MGDDEKRAKKKKERKKSGNYRPLLLCAVGLLGNKLVKIIPSTTCEYVRDQFQAQKGTGMTDKAKVVTMASALKEIHVWIDR